MNILFIAGDVQLIGGIEKYNRDFLRALRDTGSQVSLITRNKGGLWAKCSFFFRVQASYFRHPPDLIICAHLNFAPLCLLFSYLRKTRFILALYGIEIPAIQHGLSRKSALRAFLLVTISEYSRSLILEYLPEAVDRIYMLPSAVDGSIFKIEEKSSQLGAIHGLAGRPVILTLARLSSNEYKGQDRVLKALPLVLEYVPDAVYLVVGGGNDDRVNSILLEHPELNSSVVFAGPVPDDQRVHYYNLADVFVLPSKYEGFGIVFIESLACGIPVVSSDVFGCHAGLLNGELGITVPPDDVESIALAIISVLKRSAPPKLYDREWLRHKTLDVYGMDIWNHRVDHLVKMLAAHCSENRSLY